MTSPLLTTKLYIPPVRLDLVSRPRLIEKLNLGLRLNRKLTLVSAPAGYGKTTLLSEWVHQADLPVAWLSLDKEDNDPTRFLTYTTAALQTINVEFGRTALALLQSPQPPPAESILTSLINDITETSSDTLIGSSTGSGQASRSARVLILDDYHVIEAAAVDSAVEFLFDHLPPPPRGIHVIISGRTDPSVSLARQRAGGELTEIRVADLRFTRDEVAALMERALGLRLSAENVTALETRTEGWIAGLQLVALSMQGEHPNHIPRFIQTFTGSHRYVVDYLVEQVLNRRPPGTRSFLLETSILNRLSGPLCDAVRFGFPEVPSRSDVSSRGAIGEDSQRILEALEAANLFVVPLDHERRWYRYHHLFADVLGQQLRRTQPQLIRELHQRASAWYAANGFTPEAVQHALAAEDFERAALLIEPIGFLIMTRSEWATLSNWLDAMPPAFMRTRPWLLIFRAWMLRRAGQYDAVAALVQDAEQALGATDTPVKPDEKDVVRAHIASLRAYVAIFNGEIPRAIEFAHQALEYFPPEDMIRGVTGSILGIASRMSGDLVAAEQTFAESRSLAQASDNVFLTHIATWHIGYTQLLQGRLHQAAGTYREALKLAAEQEDRRVLFAGQPHVYLGAILCEWNELKGAETHLKAGVQLCGPTRLLDALTDGYAALARVYLAQGDLQAALAASRDAQRLLQVPNPEPMNVVRVDDCRIRLWLAQRDLAAAARWVQESGLRVDDEIHFRRELEHINLARVLVALGIEQPRGSHLADVQNLLSRLLEAAETAGWMGKAIEILVLQALAFHAQRQTDEALFALERALSRGERDNYVRVFADEGAPMETLLRIAASRGVSPHYVGKLLSASDQKGKRQTPLRPEWVATSVPGVRHPFLPEPLSDRELDVLRLVATGLTNRAIALELSIAISTVKTHMKNIHAKLGVRNRTQAVARARELDLLP